jgi:hypothetical protein
MQPPHLHVFLVTAEGPGKCAPALQRLWDEMVDGVQVSLLSGAEPNDAPPLDSDAFPGLELRHFPGESVWHLRRHIAPLLQGATWMVLLEDHNVPLPGWLPRLMAALGHINTDIQAVFGTTDNLTSTGPWDWANFLAVQVFHWAPGTANAVHVLPFNAAFRVSQLPPAPWKLGTFETVAVPSVATRSRLSADFPVDHIQYRCFPSVLGYHFANGRATGAQLREHRRRPFVVLLAHLAYVLIKRPALSALTIWRHPRSHALPAGTWWRLPVLLWAHACGAVVGWIAGAGQAMWQLE